MEENNNNQNSINTEELKNQTVNTAKQVKDTIKNVNIKEETVVTKNTVVAMFKDPIGTVENVAEDKENKFFKTSLFLIIVWAAIVLLRIVWSGVKSTGYLDEDAGYFFKNYIFKLSTLWDIIAPALIVIVYAVIAFALNKNNKKSLPEVIAAVTVAYVPVILGKVISLLTLLSSDISKITSRISSILSTVTIVLLYFSLRKVFNENDDKKFIKTFALIIIIYELVSFVLSFMKIYI